jgi:hypothetical protein
MPAVLNVPEGTVPQRGEPGSAAEKTVVILSFLRGAAASYRE